MYRINSQKAKFEHVEVEKMTKFTEKHRILVTVERVLQNMQKFLNFSKPKIDNTEQKTCVEILAFFKSDNKALSKMKETFPRKIT